MELSELLKTSVITGIELHACCLVLILFLYENMRRSFIRSSRKKELPLTLVYIGTALMVISDCLWTSVSSLGTPGNAAAYAINLVYFISNSSAAVCWFIFSVNHLETRFSNNKALWIAALVPYTGAVLLYLLSPRYGLIFSIQEGVYVRGSLFFIEPVIKMAYMVLPSVLAILCGSRKTVGYLRRRDFNFALFGGPVIACGILQTITGVDFNCLGVTFGLILIYITGITNPDSENTDAIYSLANSFEASYIVNLDTGVIRPPAAGCHARQEHAGDELYGLHGAFPGGPFGDSASGGPERYPGCL